MASLTTLAEVWMLLLLFAVADGTRLTRQASRCTGGTPCIPLSSCPAIQNLLRNPSRRNLVKVRAALCSTSRQNPKVCCDSSEPPVSVTPPVSITPPSTDAPLTPPTSPGNGESLLPKVCGQGITRDRIVNGEDVPLGSYPWMALLGYPNRTSPDGELDWGCGGVLINNRYVLTAAHCVVPEIQLAEVRLGEHNLDTSPDCLTATSCAEPHQNFKVTRSQIISHPNYDTRAPISDDIALIRLDRPATLNNYVHPICLPSSSQLNVKSFLGGKQAVVAGWGRTEAGSKSRILKRVTIPFIDLQQCQPIFQNILVPEQICMGAEERRDSCTGDSGGPVFHANRPDRHTVIGVVSFGSPKACGVDPSIYTNVASYRSWILQNLRP